MDEYLAGALDREGQRASGIEDPLGVLRYGCIGSSVSEITATAALESLYPLALFRSLAFSFAFLREHRDIVSTGGVSKIE